MRTITREFYLEVLLGQLASLHSNEDVHPDDLEALVSAYESAKQMDFKEVEVIQDGDLFKFRPILEQSHD